MGLRLRSLAMLWLMLLFLLALCGVEAKKHTPKVKKTEFDFPITDLRYFEDSETIIIHSNYDGSLRVSHDGGVEWGQAKGIGDEPVRSVWFHPIDHKRAYAVGAGYRHWYTKDQGKTWDHFELDHDANIAPTEMPPPFSFHADDSDKVILNTHTQPCFGPFCDFQSFYTTDGFETGVKELRDKSKGCLYARATPNLAKSVSDRNDELVLCIVEQNELSLFGEGQRVLMSDDYFKTEMSPKLDGNNEVQGVISMAAVKGYIVAAQKAQGSAELALFVTDDAEQWDRAEFPKKVEEDAYTMLESTDYSIQVSVMTTGPFNSMGSIFSSNSNGTYYHENVEHVNRNEFGIVDFEKVQGIQGIFLVNTVHNWEDVANSALTPKKLITRITFDDGHSFQGLKVIDKDGKATKHTLHLHSVTSMKNSGRVFSSPAPGLIMGVGNTGDFLKGYKEGDLYVSDDAGLTWRRALEEAHKYEFGDQGSVLLAINDEEPTKKVSYSLTHGKKWDEFELDKKITAGGLTTTPDSTSLKFVLVGIEGGGSNAQYVVYSIDFEGLHEGECKKGDFEEWTARKDEDGKPDCLMGHTQSFRRRKADVECFINEEFEKPEMLTENCACTAEDFECEYNFVQNDGECVPSESFEPAKGVCQDAEKGDKFKTSAYRLIPGNTCTRKNGKNLDEDEKEFDCGAVKSPSPKKDSISTTAATFTGKTFRQKVYLERTKTSSGDDETVLVRTDSNEIFITKDQGKHWERVEDFGDDQILGIYPHQYNHDMVFFLTNSKTVHYSVNRGKTFNKFTAETRPVTSRPDIPPLSFHVEKRDWLIWIGEVDCDVSTGGNCHINAHYSTDRGGHWSELARYCRRCEFIKRENWPGQNELVYCEQYEDEDPDGPLQLVSSNDWFGSEPKKQFTDIVAFATMSGFIVVANKDSSSNLKIDASIDGETFADARFPQDFNVPHRTAYTLLDSSTQSIFLEVTVENRLEFEYGQLMKSNSNGTSYVSLINAVNQNSLGFVDFEKMSGLPGTALVNTVANFADRDAPTKLLRTKITHNDGAAWSLIHNVEDQTGDRFECDPQQEDENCALHLHGYTERADPRDTFSSPSAVGMMVGVGNVGPYLYHGNDKTDTFLTRDGGITWKRIRMGKYMWEYGDRGSIIVIVQDQGTTNKLWYTLDEGATWADFEFADSPITVEDLTTVPSDKSYQFIVWGVDSKGKLVAINIDFEGLRSRTCKLDEDSGSTDEGDYELWSPKHPAQDTDCLFGHKTTQHRKKPDADCWNDPNVNPLHSDLQNCTCSRMDFECDYNYQLTTDNNCLHVAGTEELDPAQVCKDNPGLESYHETKGFRKIPISTCTGGEYGRYWGEEKPCPGHEEEYAETHSGLSGFGFFVIAIVLPFCAAAGIGYYVWAHWDGKFGRIRLGDSGSGAPSDVFHANQPWIKYPVAALSATVAIIAAIPMLLGAAWRQVASRAGGSRRYTTRESFARGRAQYAVVDQDEDELLGPDEDDF